MGQMFLIASCRGNLLRVKRTEKAFVIWRRNNIQLIKGAAVFVIAIEVTQRRNR